VCNVDEDIRRKIYDRFVTFLTLLDFSNAFDTVIQQILSSKLNIQFKFSVSATKLTFHISVIDVRQ